MLGKPFWIYAASLSLVLTAGGAESKTESQPSPKTNNQQPSITGDFSFEENNQVLVALNAHLESKGTTLDAKKIRWNKNTNLIVAEGSVVYSTDNLRILGERVTLDMNSDTVIAEKVRFGRSPMYFTADELKMVKGDKTMKGLRMWQNEPSKWGMELHVDHVEYTAQDNWLAAHDVTPYLIGVPFFYIPYYGQEGYSEIPYDVFIDTGWQTQQGGYLRTTTLIHETKEFWIGGLFDYYNESGFLIGPALRYNNLKTALPGDTQWKANFQAGYIHDNGDLYLTDDYGRIPGRDRFFALGDLNGKTAGGVEIAGQIYAESDANALRDYRPASIPTAGLPQANLEISSPFAGGFISATVIGQADNYQDIVQHLPELRFDLPQNALGVSGLYQRSFVSLSYLYEHPSAQVPLATFYNITGSNDAWTTARLDTYYGLLYPWAAQDWLTVKPVLGVRTTAWSTGLNNSGPATKIIGQAGFDIETLFTGSWDFSSEQWGINGVRHSLRPIIQFRELPGADRDIGTAPVSDRAVALSTLGELDLADRADAASTTETQITRIGVRNTFETKDEKMGTRELIRADVFTEWRQLTTGMQQSDVLTHIRLTPATWVTLDSSMRFGNGTGTPLESLQSIGFNSGDFWSTSITWVDLEQITTGQTMPTRQLILQAQMALNSIYSVYILNDYDAYSGQSVVQSIGITQKIGNSWMLDYGIDKRLSVLGSSSLGFHLRAQLFKF
jgi:hypothetical protein